MANSIPNWVIRNRDVACDAFFIVKAGEVIESETRPFVDVQPELVQRYRNAQFDVLRSGKLRELFDKAAIEPREDLFLATLVDSAVAQLARKP